MDERLERVAEELWDFAMEASPSSATLLGDHRFDDRIEDLSEEADARHLARLKHFADRVRSIPSQELSAPERVTRDMLLHHCREEMTEIEHRFIELRADQMLGPHSWLLRMAGQFSFPEPEHARSALNRFSAVGTMLDQASDRFRAGLAAGRTHARVNLERSMSMLDAYLGSPVETDPFVNVSGPSDWEGEAEWRGELRRTVQEEVRPAFGRYRDVLVEELLPHSRPPERSGLRYMEGGEELYQVSVRRYTTLETPPAEIHRIGLAEIVEELPDRYRAIAGAALGMEDMKGIFDRLRHDPELRYSSAEQMRRLATDSIERAQEAVPKWFGALPETACVIEDVPEFLAKDVPMAYYLPPADDGSRPGIYFVNVHEPGERNRFDAEAVAFHEAVPGHHLQLALAAEMEDIPKVQRHAVATAFTEGWGLYAELLADEMGLYSDHLQRLGMLAAASWRACRLVVDTGIHHQGWDRERAIEFMRANSPVSEQDIGVEVDRYIGWPGQAVAYKMGQREILRLREEARRRMGDRFDIREFHDTVLTQGSLTLPILEELVDGWESSSGR